MAKINLEMGFLFLYEWLPLFETLGEADAGRLMLALIRRQKDGEAYPSFGNPLLEAYAKVIDATIVRRLQGIGKKGDYFEATPLPTSPPTSPPTSLPTTPPASPPASLPASLPTSLPAYPPASPPSEAKRSVAEKSEDKRNNILSSSESSVACGDGEGDKGKGRSRREELDRYFDEFWAIYPRKVGKISAKRAFDRISPSRELVDEMISAVEHQRRSEQWTRDGGRFIPHPATWLGREQWNDELITPDFGIYYPPREDDLADLFGGLELKKGK